MNEYKNFRGRGRGPFHFRGPNPNMFNNGRGRGGNNFAPMLPAPNFRDNKIRWQRPHMNAYNWRPPNINAPSFHHNVRFPPLPPPRHPMPPRPLMSKPPVISRPLSPLPGSEEARQKAIAEASARIKEQLNLNEGASTSIHRENIPATTLTPVNIQTPQCFVSIPSPAPHDENQHKIPEKITRKRVRKSTNSVQSVDVEELRKKILTQFTYMSKGKIQSLVNNPGSTRYDAALQHLVRDMRLHLSSELRTMYNNRENEYSKESNEMIDHFNSIVPDLGVELVSLPDTMVAELSKILQLDINNDLEVPERRSSSGSDCTLVEPEKMFKEAEKLLSESNFITMHPFEDEVDTSRTAEFALNSRTIDTSANSTQQAVETMSENAFLAMNSSNVQSCSIFMDAMHSPATSNYNVSEPVDDLLSESTYLTTQAPTTFLCALDDRTLDGSDQCLPVQVNTQLESDILTMIPCSEQLKTNDYVDNDSVCREQSLWDEPCDNMSPDFIGICEDEIIHIPEPLAIDDTDYTVDNIIFNMDDTNVINMDVSNSNLDTTDLIPDDSKLNDSHTNRTYVNIDSACKSTDLDVSNTEFIVNNTNVDFTNTNFNLDNTNSNIDKTNLKNVNTIECNTVQVKQNSVKKKNLINIKLNLNKTNFHVNKANLRKDHTSLTMDGSSLSLDDITLPPVNFDVSVNNSNIVTTDSISMTTKRSDLTMNPANPTAANTVINTEIIVDNTSTSELTVNNEVAPDLNDINHNMNNMNPNMNDEINPIIPGINPSPEDTDPFLTKNPLFNPPPSTPRIRSCSPDVRFCNPPFEPPVPANVIHDSSELQASNNQLDIDLLDRIANISATLNKDDTNAIKTVAQHCPSNVNTVNNASTLFDFDSVWISKKNLPTRQTSVNNSTVNNNTNTTENNAPKRDLKSKQTASTSTVSNKSEENLSRSTCNPVKSINVQQSKFITRSKSHESIYEMTRERFHDSLSDRVPSVDSSRTSSINHEERQHDVHANSYDKNTDGRHNRYKYNRRCKSKSPTDSHRKYKQSLNERIRNMMTVKNDTTDKRKLSKRQQKELYKRKMLEEQNAKFKAKKKRFKVCVASEKDRQMSTVRNIREDGQIKKKCENVQKRRIENVPKKKTIGVRQKVVENVQIIEVRDESKSQIEEVQKKNIQKQLIQNVLTQKKLNEAVLKKKLETIQTKNVEDTQKKTAQNVQNKKDKDITRKKVEEAQKKKSDNTPKKIANDMQKMNTGDLQSNRIEKAVSLHCAEYPGSYTPPISCVTLDIMTPKHAESQGNSLQSSANATSKVVVQSISSVTNIDSGTADNNKFTSRATIEQMSPVRNTERKLPGTPVKTPAQKKEYSIDNSPSRKLVGLKRDIEQNITKLAQTVQNILKTNAVQQKLSVAAPLTTSDDQLTVRTSEVTSDNVSVINTEPVKRTVKVTRSKITQNDNITDSVNVNNSKRPSDTNKSNSNSTVNTSNVKANTSNVNPLRKVNEQIELYTSEKTSKNSLKTLAKKARIEQTQTDTVSLEIKEEPESTSSSSDESNDYLDVGIKQEDESSNKVIEQLPCVQECANDVTVSNLLDKVNSKHSNDSTHNKEISEPKNDNAQPDTPIDKTIEEQPKENASNKTQSKEISDPKQSDKIDNILVENSDSVQRDLNKSIEPVSKRNADINTLKDMAKEICQEVSNKDESKGKESKDTRNKRTEKTDKPSVNKIDKSNKAEKSSSSRSNSKEKITIPRGKSVDKEKGDRIKRKEVSKSDKPRDRSKESDKQNNSVDKINVDTLKPTNEPKTHSEEMKKLKSNSNLPQKKSNKNEDQHKKSASTKDKSTSTVKTSTIKKPETKTKSTNTPHEKLDKPSSHKESPKKTKESDKSYSRKEKDKKDSTEHSKSVDTTLLTPNLDIPKESIATSSLVNSTLSNSTGVAQPIEICIPIDASCHPRDNILNRLISIDMEIQKLMHEKWNLYKKLQISDMQVPLLMPNIQVDSPKPCICTESSRKRAFSPSHSEISVGENITSTYSRTHLSVTPSESSSIEKESEMPSKKRRLSITLSESSVSESVHRKTPLEQSRMRQLSVTPTETITINEMQQIRAETPISIPIMNQQVSNTPSQSIITNESSQILDDTPISVASRPRQVSVTPSESSVTNDTSQNLVEVSISQTLRPRQLSVTPSESSVTNETLQIRGKTPIFDILRPRQLSVTPSESSVTNDNPRKRPLSITPSESSLTEHTESVKNDNDPSDDMDSEMQANKTPKKKRLQKRITPKRKKKKSADDLEDPIDVFTEDDANNDSNSNVQKFRVKLPNMKTRNKNRKLLDLFTENDETRLNRSERAMKPDTNITNVNVHVETVAVQKCKQGEGLEEVACVKSRNKNKSNPDNVEEDMEQVQPQETMKTDVKTRTTSKIKKPIGVNYDMEVIDQELHKEIHSPTVKSRNKNKIKQDKRIQLESATSQETKHGESLMKQSEIIAATENRGRKTRTSISIEVNVEQTQNEEATQKDDVSRKNKMDEIPVIKTRTRIKSRSTCNVETEQGKNVKTLKANDDAKEDIDKSSSKRLKTNTSLSQDVTDSKQTLTCDESSEDDNIPLLVRVATLFKDNEPEVKPTKSKTKVTKNKNKLIEELPDRCAKEISAIGMETRRRSTSLCKETIDSKDKLKTTKVAKDYDSTISAPLAKDTAIDVGNLIEKPGEKPESKLIPPVINPVDPVSSIQRTSSLSKDASSIAPETEQIVSDQPRKVGRPKSKKKIIRKPKLEDISTSEIPVVVQMQSNIVECLSPVVTTPCFVQLERVNIPAIKPDKSDTEAVPMPNLSPAIEILPEVQPTIVEEQPIEDTVNTPIIVEISVVDNTILTTPSTSKTIDDNPIEHHDNNIVQNSVEPEQNTSNKQDDVSVPGIIETETVDNVTVEQKEEVQNITLHEEPLPTKEIVEEVDLIGDDGIFCMGHQKSILDLKVIGDEFLAASEDGTIYKYCMKTGSLQDAYTGHKKAVTCMYLVHGSVLNIDSPLLYSGSLDCCLKCYNIDTAETVHHVTVEQAIQCMDSAWGHIFLGTYDGLLFIYNIKKKLLHDQSLTIASATVLMIKATTEGSRQILILASRKREIMVRDAFTGLLLRTMCQEQRPTIYSLYLDRSMVYCGTSDKGILILDFNNGSQIGAYTAGKGVVCMLMYKALLFAGCYDGMIYVYNTRTHKQVKAIAGPGDGMLLSLAISNNIIIAGTKKDHLLKIWKIPQDILHETLS